MIAGLIGCIFTRIFTHTDMEFFVYHSYTKLAITGSIPQLEHCNKT